MRQFVAFGFTLGLLALSFLACSTNPPSSNLARGFDEACANWCTMYSAPGCNGFTQDACIQSCSATKEQTLGGHCLDEYANLYGCMANHDATCATAGGAKPEDQCPDEQQRAIACSDDVGCNIFCNAAIVGGCGGSSEAECLADCNSALPADTSCRSEYSLYRKCQGESLVCVNGEPTKGECAQQRESFANCLGSEGTEPDPCAGPCFVARDDGCFAGDDKTCRSQCGAMTNLPPDASGLCANTLDTLMVCQGKHVVCQNGTLVAEPDSCLDAERDAAICLADNDSHCLSWCWYQDVMGCVEGDVETCRAHCQSTADNNPACQSLFYSHLTCGIHKSIVCDPQSTLCPSHELQQCLLK